MGISMEEKVASKESESEGNGEGEEVSKRVEEDSANSESENGGDNESGSQDQIEENRGETGDESVGVKRRRGRPRKNRVDGEQLAPESSPPAVFLTSPFQNSLKRGRGRPRGSGKLQLLASLGGIAVDTAGGSFTPHVLNVQLGEDIVSKVSLFSKRGPRAVCILSASGVVSIVIIRQPGSSGSILRYEGRFEILTLSGSYLFGEMNGKHGKRAALSVLLAKPDGRVFGGEIAGSMIAAAPVQLVLGSFKQNISKEIKKWHSAESSPVLSKQVGLDLLTVPTPGKTSDPGEKGGDGEVSSHDVAIDSNQNPTSVNGEREKEEATSTSVELNS